MENLLFIVQVVALMAFAVGVPTLLLLAVLYTIDACRWGRWQRHMSPKGRRRMNGTMIASHIGRVRN
jgi:hypothetical protein